MDPWNPVLAEIYVKRLPLWKVAVAAVVGVFVFLSAMWGVTVFLFSLEKIT